MSLDGPGASSGPTLGGAAADAVERAPCGQPCGQRCGGAPIPVEGRGTGLWTGAARRRGRAADQPQWLSTGCGGKKVDGQEPERTYDAGPVAALRRIAFLMERGREESRRIEAFRAAAATILPLADRRGGRPGRRGHAHRAARHRAQHQRGHRRRRARRGPGAAGQARGRSTTARWRPAAASSAPRCGATSTATPTGPTAARRSRRWPSPRSSSATTTSCSPTTRRGCASPTGSAPSGWPGSSAWSRRSTTTSSGTFTLLKGIEVDILDDGSLDQTEEMLGRLDVRVASVHSKLRDGRDRDDPPDDRRDPQPVHQRPGPLHRPARHRQPRRPPEQRVRRAGGVRGVRRARRRRRDQLPSRAARPADEAARARPRHSAACSPSTATPTRPGSSTCSTTAASGPRRPASTPTGSSTPGRGSGSWPGRTR